MPPQKMLGWLLFITTPQEKSIGEDVDKSEPLCTVAGTIKG